MHEEGISQSSDERLSLASQRTIKLLQEKDPNGSHPGFARLPTKNAANRTHNKGNFLDTLSIEFLQPIKTCQTKNLTYFGILMLHQAWKTNSTIGEGSTKILKKDLRGNHPSAQSKIKTLNQRKKRSPLCQLPIGQRLTKTKIERDCSHTTPKHPTQKFFKEDKWYNLGNAKQRGLSPRWSSQKKNVLTFSHDTEPKWEKERRKR